MVSGRLTRIAFALALLAGLLALPAPASADSRRIAIGDYRWSPDQDLRLDLGEHVTWYWVGPDTVHSITGDSPDAAGIDSDAGRGQPEHDVGDTFRVGFDEPGVYRFRCKIHSSVRGTVTVSGKRGDPGAEPDPIPESNVDLEAPALRDLKLRKRRFGRRGTNLRYSIDEESRLVADYYRFGRDGRRRFAGWASWKGRIGYNSARFGTRRKNFRPRPGRYVAILRASDRFNNETPDRKLGFKIRER